METTRISALVATNDATAGAITRLEQAKPYLNHLTPEEAQLWFLARQACDRLYVVLNEAEMGAVGR